MKNGQLSDQKHNGFLRLHQPHSLGTVSTLTQTPAFVSDSYLGASDFRVRRTKMKGPNGPHEGSNTGCVSSIIS